MPDDPIEAFAWLLAQFRRYARNEINWLEVRETLIQAEMVLEVWCHDHVEDET